MNKLKKALNHIGIMLGEDKDEQSSPPDNLKYELKNKPKGSEKLILHRDFLKSIEAEENNRLALIESKTSQLVSQTGVIFALLSLFIPLVLDKIDSFSLKLPVFILLVFAFLFYFLTILNASKNFNLKKFIYSRSKPTNVIKHRDNTVEDFLVEEIEDLLYAAKLNVKTNNDKASNLIYSYNSFRIANFLTAILGIILCFFILFAKQKKDSITIENPIKIENCIPVSNQIQR